MAQDKGVPTVDLAEFINGDAKAKREFAKQLGKAFHEVGFVAVTNHGIPKELVDGFYGASKQFFNLPEKKKRKYEKAGLAGQRGYTSFGKEHAKHTKVADLKEFYQIGQYVPKSHPLKGEYPDNPRVAEVPNFSKQGKELYKAFEVTGSHLLQAIGMYLKIGKGYFKPKIKNGNSILRSIYYPPIVQEPASAIRAEQHEDINLITLLVGASAGGLELLDKKNQWKAVSPGPDEIVVNVGDMLQRLTNNYLKSTTHRVVNPPRSEWHNPRLSIPFFLHPQSSMDLTCLPKTVSEKRPAAYPPTTAGEYLNERLREIGLKK